MDLCIAVVAPAVRLHCFVSLLHALPAQCRTCPTAGCAKRRGRPFVSSDAVIGRAVYSAKAVLHGKGRDAWEMIVESA